MVVIYKEDKNGKRQYIPKNIDYDEGLSFTKNIKKAKNFEHGMWGAETELEFIKCHFSEKETKGLKAHDTYDDEDYEDEEYYEGEECYEGEEYYEDEETENID